ncbi:MAG TPA: HAMP domain-containing sensor histidine kinase [Algoriphagus sp.]|nr:HAMP domain-containing sensor histidine kinase [Algoriphagus sp.]
MKKLQFKRLGFLIGFTLLVTIGVQAWRMYSQFQIIRRQLVVDIQQSLDNALESYFAELAKTDVISMANQPGPPSLLQIDSLDSDHIAHITINRQDSARGTVQGLTRNNIRLKRIQNEENSGGIDSIFWQGATADSTLEMVLLDPSQRREVAKNHDLNIFYRNNPADSINQLKYFTSKVIISITRDSLDFDKIKSFLEAELDRRKIEIDYELIQSTRRIPRTGEIVEPPKAKEKKSDLSYITVSRSTFLPPGQSLEIHFEIISKTLVRRGIFEIATSLAFLGIIVYAFYYLYQTIKNQKEIAEIKQDLIANITHEFKTPIATTLSAIEGIEKFNPGNDPEKTKKYLGISKSQMHKLNQMVEKLLETATLDSDQLPLHPEPVDPEVLLRSLVQKFQTMAPEKSIELTLPSHCKPILADPFHFENVISNLLDNAIKYGGDLIRICLDQNGNSRIRIWDNGGNIASAQKERVFEQFYRIPQGDLHEVKGFGIGLYYVKKILEKHGGSIELDTATKHTAFTTIWP